MRSIKRLTNQSPNQSHRALHILPTMLVAILIISGVIVMPAGMPGKPAGMARAIASNASGLMDDSMSAACKQMTRLAVHKPRVCWVNTIVVGLPRFGALQLTAKEAPAKGHAAPS